MNGKSWKYRVKLVTARFSKFAKFRFVFPKKPLMVSRLLSLCLTCFSLLLISLSFEYKQPIIHRIFLTLMHG
eukprot:UN11596